MSDTAKYITSRETIFHSAELRSGVQQIPIVVVGRNQLRPTTTILKRALQTLSGDAFTARAILMLSNLAKTPAPVRTPSSLRSTRKFRYIITDIFRNSFSSILHHKSWMCQRHN